VVVAKKNGLRWIEVTDFLAPLSPLAFAAGRLGNFINGELPAASPPRLGMVFQGAGPSRAILRSSTSSP